MRRRTSLFVRIGSWLGCAALLGGCTSRDLSLAYIDDDTAYVRCTQVQGPSQQLASGPKPPSLSVPAGFYVGDMKGPSLALAGFAQDSTVCVTLQAPTSAVLVSAKSQLLALARVKNQLESRIEGPEPCGCQALYLSGLRSTLHACEDKPMDQACLDKLEVQNAFASEIEAFERQIASTVAPPRHWRMVGRAGSKKGWVRNYPRLVGAFRGGSEVFLRRRPVMAGKNQALVEALLKEPGVTAVVRQAGGRALLVVRYLRGGALVLDYFEHLKDPQVSVGLLNKIDNASIEAYKAALQAPKHPKRWPVRGDAKLGWGWQLQALERLDAAQEVMSYLGTAPYDPSKEIWRHPVALAQSGWVRRQDDADAWSWSVTLQDVEPSVLGEDLFARKQLEQWSWPRFVASDRRRDFPLRASAWGQGWIYALSSLPRRLADAAAQQTGSLQAREAGFGYQWEAHELPKKHVASPSAHAFFAELRKHAGTWTWEPGAKPGQVQLNLRIEKATKPAPRRPPRGGRFAD